MLCCFEPAFAGSATARSEPLSPADAEPGGFRRLYLDLPGTGGSAAGEPTSEAVLSAVRATLDHLLGDEPFWLAGHSYGGYLAAGLARRCPERLIGLLLVCVGPRIRPADRDLSEVLPSKPEPGWLDEVPSGLREHFEHAVGEQTRAVAARLSAAFARRQPVDEDYLAALRPKGYQLADEADLGPSFPGPVLLLAGRRDRIAGHRDSVAALSRYPNGGCAIRARAGHYLPFEDPAGFAALTRCWLAADEVAGD